MQIFDAFTAYNNLLAGARGRNYRYPTKQEAGYVNGVLLPKVAPKFALNTGEKVFTIGSCFAREIEERLTKRGFDVPVGRFTTDPREFGHAAPHLLNEYNAGTILQRIESVFGQFEYKPDMGIEETDKGFIDLFLHIHTQPVPLQRLLERREEIKAIYSQIITSSKMIITLGLTETWFDSKFGCYLNKAPSRKMIEAERERFVFHRMDVEDVASRIENAIQLINAHTKNQIILTLSPIPLEATFSGENAIIANSYSKAVLRVVAEQVRRKFDNVDYFPSYEIATSGGMQYFIDDNVHVSDEMVNMIMGHLLKNYYPEGAEEQPEGVDQFGYIDAEVVSRLQQT